MEIVKAFNSNKLHTEILIKGDLENPLFRANDIATVLDINNIRQNILDFDNTEKIIETIQTIGGSQQVSFLTEKGLYKILFKSRKPIAQTFQNWVCNVIKEIRLSGSYSLQKQLEEQLKINEELQKTLEDSTDSVPTIYIWNTNTLLTPPELKIGITINLHKRVKPYKQINKHGKIEFSTQIHNIDIKIFEKIIHNILLPFKIQDEVFKLDVEEAKIIIVNFINFINIVHIHNSSERLNKLQQMYDSNNKIIHNIQYNPISKCSIGIQTDINDDINYEIDNNSGNFTQDIFRQYIDENCIVREDVEISSVDILGQFRIWSKSASKKNYHELKNYLDTNFKPCKLSIQNKNQIINGYKGITLHELEYKRKLIPCDIENFIFTCCIFHPSGKVLHSTLLDEYIKWKKTTNNLINNNETKEIRNYLQETTYTIFSTIWTNSGNGQGYYGISLKTEQNSQHRKTSSTGKKVEKRQINTNILLGSWETIHKASDYEKISSAKLSRIIKNKTQINDYYFITI